MVLRLEIRLVHTLLITFQNLYTNFFFYKHFKFKKIDHNLMIFLLL